MPKIILEIDGVFSDVSIDGVPPIPSVPSTPNWGQTVFDFVKKALLEWLLGQLKNVMAAAKEYAKSTPTPVDDLIIQVVDDILSSYLAGKIRTEADLARELQAAKAMIEGLHKAA